MLQSFQETIHDFILLQATQMKFQPQPKITQFRYKSSTKQR